MNNLPLRRGLAALALCLPAAALAHGDEPHGDAPHPAAGQAASAAPRLEAATDTFELVGRLGADGLVLDIHRFASSAPVLAGQVELESGPHKATAVLQSADGSWLVRDAALLAALRQPGSHAVVVTVLAGDETDLLDATLQVGAGAAGAGPGSAPAHPPAGGLGFLHNTAVVQALAALLALGAAAAAAGWLRQRRRQRNGALS